MFAAISKVTVNGIKFNGQNYDDWIEYVKLNAGLLGLDSTLVMDEPTKPTDTSLEADKKIWENWERSNRLMMSFLKLSIAPNVKPSQPKTENVREFVTEIKKCTMIDIVDKSIVAALINDLSNREYTIAQSMEEHITHMVNTYNQLKSFDMDLGERVLVEFLLKSCSCNFGELTTNLRKNGLFRILRPCSCKRKQGKGKTLRSNFPKPTLPIMVNQTLVLVAAKRQVRNGRTRENSHLRCSPVKGKGSLKKF